MIDNKKAIVWRESASLILVARNAKEDVGATQKPLTDYDYNILMMKRSDNTAVLPDQCVFPGGIFESADETVEWMKYFQEFGVPEQQLRQLVIVSDQQRPSILAPQGTGCYDRFFKKSKIWAREISLRITAIREMFEEVGILLCRSKVQLKDESGFALFLDDIDKKFWQQAVHNDANAFLNMCRHLNVVPDLWGLMEWSVWASPAPIPKRNETAFFIAFVSKMPKHLTEAREVKECMWHQPSTYMELYRNGAVGFMPPQVYEVARFMSVQSFETLHSFALQRSLKGVTLFLPASYICTDGLCNTLPGDDFYLENARDLKEFIPTHVTIREFRDKAKHLHRFEYETMQNCVPLLNFEPFNGHLPLVGPNYIKSKM